MRKLTVWMQMSLDGYAASADGALDWPVVTDELTDYWLELSQTIDTFVYGRKVWGIMSNFWPTADTHPEAGGYQKAYARIWRETPKIVVSRTLESAAWDATIIGDDLERRFGELKQQEGKDIAVFGGPETTASLIELGLIDEYHLFVHPVALGAGKPLFPTDHERTRLELLAARPFSNAVIATHYRTAH